MRRCRSMLLFSFLLAAFLISVFPSSFAWSKPALETSAVSAVLMDAYSGKILYEKEPHRRLPPASVTKIMTMLVAMDAIKRGKVSWNDKVVTSEAAWEMGGSEIWLEPGEEMTLREMMIAIAVGSANDACVAVAEHIAGSEEAYVELMNLKARSLGLKNTHFVNCHGLPAKDHYTSAYDMAVICREALKYPELLELTRIKHYSLRGGKTRLDNTNKLLWWYDGTDGFKTGWTTEANYCLASTVKRGNTRLICTVFGVPEAGGHFRESVKLYNWGFANYELKKLFEQGQQVGVIRVDKGVREGVKAVAPRLIGVLVRKGEEQKIKTEINLKPSVPAPVKRGMKVGEVLVYVDGRLSEKVPLVAGEDVAKGTLWQQFKKGIYQYAL
ncbi:MAG: D-alanyl-D-alanine carboxypeptidase family protein [Thermacetogeniaceae bacterium]